MSATGYLKVWAFTSAARYPLEDVAIAVIAEDGTALAMALTDRNGMVDPIGVEVPDRTESQSPDPPEIPYTLVNLYAHCRGFEQIYARQVQIFADTVTMQDLKMIPLSEYPESYDQNTLYITPPQNL